MQLSQNKTLEAQLEKCHGTPGQHDAMPPTTAEAQAKGHKETESIKDLHSCPVDKTPQAPAQGGSASSLFSLALL